MINRRGNLKGTKYIVLASFLAVGSNKYLLAKRNMRLAFNFEENHVNPSDEDNMKKNGFSKRKTNLSDTTEFVDVTTGISYKFSELPDNVKNELQENNSSIGLWHAPEEDFSQQDTDGPPSIPEMPVPTENEPTEDMAEEPALDELNPEDGENADIVDNMVNDEMESSEETDDPSAIIKDEVDSQVSENDGPPIEENDENPTDNGMTIEDGGELEEEDGGQEYEDYKLNVSPESSAAGSKIDESKGKLEKKEEGLDIENVEDGDPNGPMGDIDFESLAKPIVDDEMAKGDVKQDAEEDGGDEAPVVEPDDAQDESEAPAHETPEEAPEPAGQESQPEPEEPEPDGDADDEAETEKESEEGEDEITAAINAESDEQLSNGIELFEVDNDIVAKSIKNSVKNLFAVLDKDITNDDSLDELRPREPAGKPPRMDLRTRYTEDKMLSENQDKDIHKDPDMEM